jgi:hypothetical protein
MAMKVSASDGVKVRRPPLAAPPPMPLRSRLFHYSRCRRSRPQFCDEAGALILQLFTAGLSWNSTPGLRFALKPPASSCPTHKHTHMHTHARARTGARCTT